MIKVRLWFADGRPAGTTRVEGPLVPHVIAWKNHVFIHDDGINFYEPKTVQRVSEIKEAAFSE